MTPIEQIRCPCCTQRRRDEALKQRALKRQASGTDIETSGGQESGKSGKG